MQSVYKASESIQAGSEPLGFPAFPVQAEQLQSYIHPPPTHPVLTSRLS